MMSNEYPNLERTKKTILSVEWKQDYNHHQLHVSLARESLRRLAICAKTLECEEQWIFFNILTCTKEKPESGELQAHHDQVKRHLQNSGITYIGFLWRHLLMSLNWAFLKDRQALPDNNLPNPYAPMIVAFKMGADVYREQSFMLMISEIGMIMKNLQYYAELNPVIAIDEDNFLILTP